MKTVDYSKEYEEKSLGELKKIKTRLLIESSESLGIFSIKHRKEIQDRLAVVEKLMESKSEEGEIC